MKIHSKNYLYDPLVGNFLSWLLGALIMSPYINGWSTSPILIVVGFLVGSIWTVWLHAYRQAYQIEIKKKPIDHNKAFLIRALVAIVISGLSHLLIVCACVDMVLPAIACAVYLGSIFWLLFDFMLNKHRDLPMMYRSKGQDAAMTDKAFREKKVFWIATKIVLFIFATLIYYRVLAHVNIY